MIDLSLLTMPVLFFSKIYSVQTFLQTIKVPDGHEGKVQKSSSVFSACFGGCICLLQLFDFKILKHLN